MFNVGRVRVPDEEPYNTVWSGLVVEMGIYGCWSISGDVKGLWLRAGVKTWTLLSQRPSQEYARLISITANSAPRSSVSLFFCSLSICLSLSSSALLVCICMNSNSPRTPNPCIRYFLVFSLTSQAVTTTKYDKVQLLLSWQLEILRKLFFFTFIWHLWISFSSSSLSSKVLSTLPRRRFPPPSRTCYLTSW